MNSTQLPNRSKLSSALTKLTIVGLLSGSPVLLATEFSGYLGMDARFYPENAAFEDQDDGGLSAVMEAEWLYKDRGSDGQLRVITFSPFLRLDQVDNKRTHFDIRQLDFLGELGNWEYQVGLSKVFWGVTESAHLVDILNQTDLVENQDQEEKLGQPMVRLSYLHDDGVLSAFVLPYFRERTFPGKEGRLRPAFPIDQDNVSYESSKKEKHIDFALRLQQTMDEFDLGVSYFNGTSREPSFIPDFTALTLKQYYPLIEQAGLDFQYTSGDWLWKLESIYRNSDTSEYNAEVGGFEYTLPRIAGYADLGLIAEYHHDSRGDIVEAPFQNDLFLGARIAMNDLGDSEYLLGGYIDIENHTQFYIVEYSSRFKERWKITFDAQFLVNVESTDAFNDFSNDSYVQAGILYYF